MASAIAKFPTLPREFQAEIIQGWAKELTTSSLDQETLSQYEDYKKIIDKTGSSFFDPSIYKKAVENFSAALNKATTALILSNTSIRTKQQQTTSAVALPAITRHTGWPRPSPSTSPQLSSRPSSQSSIVIDPPRMSLKIPSSSDVSLPPSRTPSPRTTYKLTSEQIDELLLDREPRAPDEDPLKTHISWFTQAFKAGIRQFPKEQQAAIIVQIQSPDSSGPIDLPKAICTWYVTQILRESITSQNAASRDLPDFLKPIADKRPNGRSLSLREMMVDFAKPEEIPGALSRQEKANVLLSAQVLAPFLTGGRPARYAENILEISALVEEENELVLTPDFLAELDLSIPQDEPSILETLPRSTMLDFDEVIEDNSDELRLPPLLTAVNKNRKRLPIYLNRETTLMYKSALANNPVEQFNLGVAYELGLHGFPKDPDEAGMWYKIAAESNLPGAKENLALYLETGRGRAGWIKFAETAPPEIQAKLAAFYEKGEHGFPQCDAEAVKWYKLSAENGNYKARDKLMTLHYGRKGGITIEESMRLRDLYKKNCK